MCKTWICKRWICNPRGRGGRGIRYNGLHGEAPTAKGTCSGWRYIRTEAIPRVEIWKRVEKTDISALKLACVADVIQTSVSNVCQAAPKSLFWTPRNLTNTESAFNYRSRILFSIPSQQTRFSPPRMIWSLMSAFVWREFCYFPV